MRISLRAGEKIYINGAVVSVDRKVSIELLNDVTFLLEAHVMQAADASTPLRQVYFAVQLMLMDPASSPAIQMSVDRMIESFVALAPDDALRDRVLSVRRLVESTRLFEALKTLRALFPLEASVYGVASAQHARIAQEG